MGGYAGLGQGLAFATEHQGDGTPHGHGLVSLANAYQHNTLAEIVELIQGNVDLAEQKQQVERIVDFQTHLHQEEHFYPTIHENNIDELERSFHANNSGERERLLIGSQFNVFSESHQAPFLWQRDRRSDKEVARTEAEADANSFERKYKKEVQYIFSRVQHHWHLKNKEGQRIPMKYCRLRNKQPQGGRQPQCQNPQCRMGMPKYIPVNKAGLLLKNKIRNRIICPGISKHVGLKCSGRRNALGSVAGKRSSAWFSGTSAMLAKLCHSNTNVQCPYRIPLLKASHDPDCKSTRCLSPKQRKRMFILSQRAMKQMIGYFGGYISKKQKLGRFELKETIKANPFLQAKLKAKQHAPSAQLALVTNRMFTSLEGKGILRTAVEEFLLASEYSPFDELAAEFLRTFRHVLFWGKPYLDRLDSLQGAKEVNVERCIPKKGATSTYVDNVSLYGFRGTDPRVYFMSPWEMIQWWKPVQLPKPSSNPEVASLTLWLDDADQTRAAPGLDYVVNDRLLQHEDILVLPELAAGAKHNALRSTWVLLRRSRPVVPCPENTPLPHSKMSSDQRSKIFSVYLRPWTLVREHASAEVPMLQELNLTRQQWRKAVQQRLDVATSPKRRRCSQKTTDATEISEAEREKISFRAAWQDYLLRILPASLRQTRNFMMAVIAEGLVNLFRI